MVMGAVKVEMFGKICTLPCENLPYPSNCVDRRVLVYRATMSQAGQLVNSGHYVKFLTDQLQVRTYLHRYHTNFMCRLTHIKLRV